MYTNTQVAKTTSITAASAVRSPHGPRFTLQRLPELSIYVGSHRNVTGVGASSQRKQTFNVARPKIFRSPDFAATITTPLRVAGSSDLIRPLNSMSAPSAADTIAGADSRTA